MHQQINLYQPQFRRRRQIFSARALLAAVGVFAASLLSIHGYAWWQVLELEAEVAQLEGRARAQAAQVARLDPNAGSDRRREIDEELRLLSDRLLHQQQLVEILREHPPGSAQGFSAQLAALARQHVDGLWLTRVAIGGDSSRMELGGMSMRPELVPEYLQRLGTEPALRGQRFDVLTIERGEGEAAASFRVSSRRLDATFARAEP